MDSPVSRPDNGSEDDRSGRYEVVDTRDRKDTKHKKDSKYSKDKQSWTASQDHALT